MPKFIYALDGEPDSLDCAKAASTRSERVSWLLFDSLIMVSQNGKDLQDGLAKIKDRGQLGTTTLDLELLQGLSFHSGRPVTPNAVRDSIQRMYDPKHPRYSALPPNTKAALLTKLIDRIDLDGHTLKFTLKFPGAHWLAEIDIHDPDAIAAATSAGVVYGSRRATQAGYPPVGTGPFKLREGQWRSDQILLERSPDYTLITPSGNIEQVEFRIIQNPFLLPHLLSTRQVHYTPTTPEPTSRKGMQGKGIQLATIPSCNIFYLGLNTTRPPLNDPSFRSHLASAIRPGNVKGVAKLDTAVRANGPLSSIPGYARGGSTARPDKPALRKLKKRFQSAPFSPGGAILLYNGGDQCFSQVAAWIQQKLEAVGIAVQPVGALSFSEMLERLRGEDWDMFVYSWHVRFPSPDRILVALFHSGAIGLTNLTRYQDAGVDKDLENAMQVSAAGPQQKALYQRIEDKIVQDAPIVPLFHLDRTVAVAKGVKGLRSSLLRSYDAAPCNKLLDVTI